MPKTLLQSLTILTGCLLSTAAAAADAAPVNYLRQIKPLLAEHCYKCHGSSQQKNGLRLDTAAFALKGGEHGPALKPGRSAESLLVQTIATGQTACGTLGLLPFCAL